MTIDLERARRVEAIFSAVMEAPEPERAELLDRECAGDEALRREVESLLVHDGGMTDMLRGVVGQEAAALAAGIDQRWIGRRVGAWKVVGILGRGGMGAVYDVVRADGAFEQRAALKIVRAEIDDDRGRRRFLEERQILGHVNHPNIARILDGGETDDGVPYLVMEAVDGLAITTHCERTGLPLAARLRLFVTVCRAVHFAHTRLIVHRDLKPSNILVTPEGTVKLLDFGIARLLSPGSSDGGDTPAASDLAMTPDYASPEQLHSGLVTTASDIYSLGAVLFELLTEQKARSFSSSSLPEIQREAAARMPLVPSAAAPKKRARPLRGDLDDIVGMALQQEPGRRYASAEQLAQDIERHLQGLPVSARANTLGYRTGKFIRRNRLFVGAASLVVLSLMGGIVGTVWQARRADRRFQQVRKLANTFLFRFHDEIRDLPGSTHARELLVTTALEYLDNLSMDAANDQQLQMELGAAYEKVGDVLGNPRNSNLGHTKQALASYEKSLRLRLTAAGRAVDQPAEGQAVLQSHLKIADMLLNSGKTEESVPHITEALALAERFGAPADRAAAFSRQGELALRQGDVPAAENAYRASVAQAQKEWAVHPGTTSSASVVAAASRLGYVYKMGSRQKEALGALDVALQSATRLHAAEPARTVHVRQIMNIRLDRGDVLRSPFASEGMRPDLSLKEYEEAQRQAAWIANADPTEAAGRVNLLLTRAQIADTWREIAPARSLPLFQEAISQAEALQHEDPANFQNEWIAALLWEAYADATRAAGLRREALPRYDTAVARIDTMRRNDRGRAISHRDLTKVLGERGALRLSLGDLQGASADAAGCRAQADSFATGKARPVDLRDVAFCYELSGDLALRKGEGAEAVRQFDQALVRWNELARRKIDSPFLREHLLSAQQRRSMASQRAAHLP